MKKATQAETTDAATTNANAKPKAVSADQIESLNEQVDLTTYGQNVKSVDDILEMAENIDDVYFDDATSEYLKLEEGEKKTLLFVGFGTMKNDQGNDVPTAIFTGAENKRFIHAGTVIVSSLKKAHSLPVVVRLTHNGEVKGKNGKKYADIRVQILKDIKVSN